MSDNSAARNAFRAIANSVRRIPESLGQRTATVTVRVRVYSAAVGASGTTITSTTDTILTPRPKVRQVSDGQKSYFGGGTLATLTGSALAGVYDIGPITPAFGAGGYDQGDLVVAASASKRVTLILDDGGNEFTAGGEEFTITAADWTHPQHGMVQATRARQGA